MPPARYDSVSWNDSSGNLWLFGGNTYLGDTDAHYFNDLWKFDGTNWIWISRSNYYNQAVIYGIKGVSDSSNIPGASFGSISWIDSSGNFWLFGGVMFKRQGMTGSSNDLWKYTP
jgi:hypothetical protein